MTAQNPDTSQDLNSEIPRAGGRTRWINLCLFLVASVVALCLLEFGLRRILPSLDSHEMYIPDPEVGNRLKPGYQGIAQGVEVSINSHGLRSPEIPLDKPDGTFRILVLGDSWTFGVCLPQDQPYPAQLERILNARFPNRKIEVINTGVAGYETYNESVYFRREGYKFEPDVVLIGYYPVNDVHDKKAKYENHAQEKAKNPILYRIKRYPKTDLRIYQYSQYLRSQLKENILHWWKGSPLFDAGPEDLDEFYQVEWTSLYRDDFSGWQVAKQSLKEIGELAKEIGARPFLAVFPDIRDLRYYRLSLRDRYFPQLNHAAEEAGIPVIDTLPLFQNYESRESEIVLGNRKGSTHPNGEGHRAIAEFLADRLIAEGILTQDQAIEVSQEETRIRKIPSVDTH